VFRLQTRFTLIAEDTGWMSQPGWFFGLTGG
jgi:hypothetical protein